MLLKFLTTFLFGLATAQYPRFFGSAEQLTKVYAVDVLKSSQEMLVGGGSLDSNYVGAVVEMTPFLLLLNSD